MSPTNRDLLKWQDMLRSTRPLGHTAGVFWQQALQLVDTDVPSRQDVVAALATEKGFIKIRETIEFRWVSLTEMRFHQRFASTCLPLLQILTHPHVLSSGLLECHVGTIYGTMFGLGGTRGLDFFHVCLRYLRNHPTSSDVVDNAAGLSTSLHCVTSAYLLLIKTVQQARMVPGFVNLFDLLTSLAESLQDVCSPVQLQISRKHLREVSIHLKHGQDIAFLQQDQSKAHTATVKPAAFKLDRPGPGNNGRGQPRHDNDFQDIQNIQILPTFAEVTSTVPEYLPHLDSTTWHKEDMPGLLDRHFRLLREDSIGQLSKRIRAELDRLQQKSNESERAQKDSHWNYDNVCVVSPHVDTAMGLEVVVTFDQPKKIQNHDLTERTSRWERSRRLQPDSVVCIITSRKRMVFCHVARDDDLPRPKKSKKPDINIRPDRHNVSLSKDPKTASIIVRPVEMDTASVETLIHLVALPEHAGKCVLVEFPGVLLPAFMPTLKALQELSKSSGVPFAEFLVPQTEDQALAIPPPLYAINPGFTFDLSAICREKMTIDPNNIGPDDRQKLCDVSQLDDSQSQTVIDALSRRLALLQGPPGTGKSFVGVQLIRILTALQNQVDLGPIICVCYTNHALDQLLEHLLDCGITQVIRMGSKSKSERLAPLNIREIAKADDKTKLEKATAWNCRSKSEDHAICANLYLADLAKAMKTLGLKNYLDVTHAEHAVQLFGDANSSEDEDEDWFTVQKSKGQKGNSLQKRLKTWLRAGSKDQTRNRQPQELEEVHLDSLSNLERANLLSYWREDMFSQIYAFVDAAREQFVLSKDRLQVVHNEIDLRVMEQAKVIGVTTSGLARNLAPFRKLSSKVLVCEEAGEVMESHLLTALLPNIEHAMLIGDHLQLRPRVQDYDLSRESSEGDKYSLDMSLFERLVARGEMGGCNLPFSTLQIQRRMHPEISNLIRSTLYPGLMDNPPVYDMVYGIKRRLFWLDHGHREDEVDNQETQSSSYSNTFEVEMVCALVSHLVKQGQRRADEIAVLTPYLGQLRKLRSRLSGLFELVVAERDDEDLLRLGLDEGGDVPLDKTSSTLKAPLSQAIRIATVDNFQGEEAPIVIVSLVRSNDKHRCGFLKTSNRINVLLSRAQQGMYIVGDAATCSNVPMWRQITELMDDNGSIGDTLELECPRHPNHPILVKEADDILRLSPDGGCDLACVERLSCGHACPHKCHAALLHDAVKCLEPCMRNQGDFEHCSHECPNRCGERCPSKCEHSVDASDIVFDCGHKIDQVTCWESRHPEQYICLETTTKLVPGCDHTVEVACKTDVGDAAEFLCSATCNDTLDCGHPCTRKCYSCRTREGGEIVGKDHKACKKICGRVYSNCRHQCAAFCHGDEPCPPCPAVCDIQCSHSTCGRKCSEPCPPCAKSSCTSACPHAKCTQPCAAPCDWIPCSLRCEKVLPCNHQCKKSFVKSTHSTTDSAIHRSLSLRRDMPRRQILSHVRRRRHQKHRSRFDHGRIVQRRQSRCDPMHLSVLRSLFHRRDSRRRRGPPGLLPARRRRPSNRAQISPLRARHYPRKDCLSALSHVFAPHRSLWSAHPQRSSHPEHSTIHHLDQRSICLFDGPLAHDEVTAALDRGRRRLERPLGKSNCDPSQRPRIQGDQRSIHSYTEQASRRQIALRQSARAPQSHLEIQHASQDI